LVAGGPGAGFPPHRLDGRVAIVTGASRNIGAAVAGRLAADGAAVAVNYSRVESEPGAVEVAAAIRRAGGSALAVRADLRDEREIAAMVETVRRELGPPEILVNNAAASVTGNYAWETLTADQWDDVLRVNVTGTFLCSRAVLASMREAGRGAIVNMSSVRARLGRPGLLHYTTSKAALIGFTRALAREVGQHGIRVNALIVGAIKTPDEAEYGDQDELDRFLFDAQALERRGVPADIGGATAYLCSDDAGFITGQAITVDGGWVMH
jgi:3-oxoacyl-[acyl-carrier protein] reductase